MLCLFVELLETFFDFGIFTSSSLLTLKLTVASLCNMLRHLDVSADTAVDFPMEELFLARMLRAYITQALRDNNLITRAFKSYGCSRSRMRMITPPTK